MSRHCCACPSIRQIGYELRCINCGAYRPAVIDFSRRTELRTVPKAEANRLLQMSGRAS